MVKTLAMAIALAFACAPSARPAGAQPADDEPASAQARRLFEEGVALANSDRWAEALSSFRRSRELVSRPSTSYNIANAYYRLDRPVEGLAELEVYDAMPEVAGDVDARERSMMLRALLEAAAAEARLAITPVDAEVFVDGRRVNVEKGQWRILLNPGLHSLRVERDGYHPEVREIWVNRGGKETYAIALRPVVQATPATVDIAPPSVPEEPIPSDRGGKKPFVKRPGFWVMIGAVAAAGVGAGVAIALTRRDDAPQCGTTGACATAQGLTVSSF